MGNRTWLVISVFIVSLAIFSLTSAGRNPHNHFVLLADSIIHGKIYIEGDMPWLEKIPIDNDKFFVANPPMPAIISIIPVLFFGKDFPQEYISIFIGALTVPLVYLIALLISGNKKIGVWSSILFGFGSINWYLITVGSTWYIAQVIAQFFILMAVYANIKKKHPILIGLLLGFAYFSRIPTILLLPFFVINLSKPTIKNVFYLAVGVLPSVLANFLYNYARFGVIWDIGYTMIPGVATEPWYQYGLVSLKYIKDHLKIILLTIPTISSDFPFIKPSLFGYAIWFTTPAFIFSVKNKFVNKDVWSTWLSIFLVSLLIFSHGSTGFSQFGYRFAADFYPLLFLLTIRGVNNVKGPHWYHWLFLLLGVIVNLWGVLFLNLLKW